MELMEILNDALLYPLNNIKSLILYVVLGIIAGIVAGGTIVGLIFGVSNQNIIVLLGSGIIGIIVMLIVGFVISGYELDIIRYGINRNSSGPSIEFIRQFINGAKLFLVHIVYYLIPIIISAIVAMIFQNWLTSILTFILFVLFGLAEFMAECRLAKSEDLMDALSIHEAISDISRVGILRLLALLVIISIVSFILFFIVAFIIHWNGIVGGIILGILGVYLVFFTGRATGLLYSNI